MFDLETAISGWREEMLAAGINSPAPLDELESHLRDDISRQVKAGLSEEAAFEISAHRLGPPALLQAEFGKSNKGLQIMLRLITTIVGLFAMIIGLGLVLPALAKCYHQPEPWNGLQHRLIILGMAIVVAGAVIAFYCIRTRHEARGRLLTAIGLLLAGVFYSIAAISPFFHAKDMTPVAWLIWAVVTAGSIAYFANCFRFNWRQPHRA